MLPGPIYVYGCPQCGHYFARGSIASGNTFGSRLYSDGKRISPMLPDFSELTRCESCHKIFKIRDARKIGSYDFWKQPEERFANVNSAEELEIADYFEAIRQGIPENKDEEHKLRREIWWAYNDRMRNDGQIFSDDQDEILWKENLEILLDLLDQNKPAEHLMMAEIQRNLGDFEACMNLLKTFDHPDLSWVKDIMTGECRRGNRWVVEVR
ncbi:MAG TPA: hypothetical protein DCX89_08845 [Saprospirales bacterium]|nr:hypothetical protein [Saprospirales bacterium]HAY71985.1 hypothetical protein [Saprospirales bacterium]HRQ29714.1 hypothetical protein [Saprospiraceae bacterium]